MRLLRLLEPPDFISLANAGLGFGAVVAVLSNRPVVAAQLILVSSIADGLDGLAAKHMTTSDLGVDLDSLADVISFGVAPAVLVHHLARGFDYLSLVPVIFVLSVLVRLAAYNVRDSESPGFTGVPSTLAGTSIAAIYLADLTKFVTDATSYSEQALVFVALSLVFSYLMLIETEYPELVDRDALGMGVFMALAALLPNFFHSIFPRIIVLFLVIFLVFSPWMYSNGDTARKRKTD